MLYWVCKVAMESASEAKSSGVNSPALLLKANLKSDQLTLFSVAISAFTHPSKRSVTFSPTSEPSSISSSRPMKMELTEVSATCSSRVQSRQPLLLRRTDKRSTAESSDLTYRWEAKAVGVKRKQRRRRSAKKVRNRKRRARAVVNRRESARRSVNWRRKKKRKKKWNLQLVSETDFRNNCKYLRYSFSENLQWNLIN